MGIPRESHGNGNSHSHAHLSTCDIVESPGGGVWLTAELGEQVLRAVPDVGAQRRPSGLVRRRAVVRHEAGRTQDFVHGGSAASRPRRAERRRHSAQVRRRRQVRAGPHVPLGRGRGVMFRRVFVVSLSVCLLAGYLQKSWSEDFHEMCGIGRLWTKS